MSNSTGEEELRGNIRPASVPEPENIRPAAGPAEPEAEPGEEELRGNIRPASVPEPENIRPAT